MPKTIAQEKLQNTISTLGGTFPEDASLQELKDIASNLETDTVIPDDAEALTCTDFGNYANAEKCESCPADAKACCMDATPNMTCVGVVEEEPTPAVAPTPVEQPEKSSPLHSIEKLNKRLPKDAKTVQTVGFIVKGTIAAAEGTLPAIILEMPDSSKSIKYGIQLSTKEYGFFRFDATTETGVEWKGTAKTLKTLLPLVADYRDKLKSPASANTQTVRKTKKEDTPNTPSTARFKTNDAGKLVYVEPSETDEATLVLCLGQTVKILSGVHKDKLGTLRRYAIDKGVFRVKLDDGVMTGIKPQHLEVIK